MKTLPINQLSLKFTKPLKKAMPIVASTMLAATALVAGQNKTASEKTQAIPATLALATMLPTGTKRKENEVEMISEDYIKIRNGKYLTENEIQTYKDKWEFLSKLNVLSEENKYIAHNLCQNPKIDKTTALKCLIATADYLKSSDSIYKSRFCNMIINSDEIPNEVLPKALSSINDFHYSNECQIQSLIKQFTPGYEESTTPEYLKNLPSVTTKGFQEANAIVRETVGLNFDYEKGKFYIEGVDYTNDYKKEILIHLQNGKTLAEIAKEYGLSEECVNALISMPSKSRTWFTD